MCYQVVERYSVCRCLYYKHPIDQCAARGQRGHIVQEKTVLVGYACSTHSPFNVSQDIVDVFVDSDDSLSDGGSIFSGVVAVSRATSFIAVNSSDTIDDILHVLLNDPLLRWEYLLCQNVYSTEDKDVHFFLRAYELSLRAAAESNIERHTCIFLRSRLRYLSSRICEHFQLEEKPEPKSYDDGTSKDVNHFDSVALDDPDPMLMPSFQRVRFFLFGGVAYEALKGNLRDFAQNKRNYLEEIVGIIERNIHPPTKAIGKLLSIKPYSLAKFSKALTTSVAIFVRQLANEAAICKLPASDRIGTRELVEDDGIVQIHARLMQLWGKGTPAWHFYPLILGDGSELTCSQPGGNLEPEGDSACEIFESFVFSSHALLGLASACMGSFQKSNVEESSMPLGDGPVSEAMVCRTKISFTCVSLIGFMLQKMRKR